MAVQYVLRRYVASERSGSEWNWTHLLRIMIVILCDFHVQSLLGSTKHLNKTFIYDPLHVWLADGLLTSKGILSHFDANKWV